MRERTTRRIAQDVSRIVLGPWQLRPAIALLVIFASNFFAMNNLAGMGDRSLGEAWGESLPASVVIACAGALSVLISQRVIRHVSGDSISRAQYLGAMLFSGCVLGLVSYLVRLAYEFDEVQVRGLLFYVGRGTISIGALHAVLGVSDARLVAQIHRTERALEEVRTQRRFIIESEERARNAVARFLHDQVQASLVAITLQLRAISGRTPEPSSSELGSIVEALEELRGVDVRSASRRLSPDLSAIGLEQALTECLSAYSDSMQIRVHLDVSLREWSLPREGLNRQSLATYRIVEQAVLNAAVHGRARNVRVDITREHNLVELSITDDGVGLAPGGVIPGSGLRVIGAWVESIGGEWRLSPGQEGGTLLHATFPITKSLANHA